jgi:hypothetical protein
LLLLKSISSVFLPEQSKRKSQFDGGRMRKLIPVVVGLTLLFVGMPSVLRAAQITVPEIDPTSGMAAAALLAGVVAMIRGRRKTAND